MRLINAADANIPLGHYSQAVVHNGIVYLSTQLGRDPVTGRVGSIDDQVGLILDSVTSILRASGSSLGSVIRVTVYLSDINNWTRVNEVYSHRFGHHKPTRGVIPCNELHGGCQVAMDVIAALEE